MGQSTELKVYHEIRQAICHRRLAPGTQLVEQRLCEQFNTSRTPVRLAFKRLEADGLIEIIQNRGAFIVQPKLEKTEQAFQLRSAMECLAVDWFPDTPLTDLVKNLQSLIKKEKHTIQKKNIWEYLQINKQFHLNLCEPGRNHYLQDSLKKVLDDINVYLLFYDRFYDSKQDSIHSIKDHEQMITLIRKQDYSALKKLLTQHSEVQIGLIKSGSHSFDDLNTAFSGT